MITFWIAAGGLIFGVTGLLVWPLLKRESRGGSVNDKETLLSVYRQQFAELEEDRHSGAITVERYQQAKQELERRVLEEAAATPEQPVAHGRLSPRLVGGMVAILLPLASLLLYWKLGTPLALTHPLSPAPDYSFASEAGHQSTNGLDDLTVRLKRKLEQNPDDGVGWALLARSYVELGRHADAVPTYERAMTLLPDDAQLLADYADALGMLHGRSLEGKPEMLIQQALRADPRNVKALMLAGTVAFDRREFARAAQYWEQARTNLPSDAEPEVVQELMSGIGEARGLAKGGALSPKPVATAMPSGKQPGSDRSPLAVTGRITLASSLASKVAATDTLFVFARAVDGPPMPVAIVRLTKQELPFSFRLDDTNSPMPSRKLSDMDHVMIVARLSKSGDAMPKSGDLQGKSQPVTPGTQGVSVEIDSVVP